MTEVVLWVGVYGDGTSFSVRIPSNATVEDLKKAIVHEKKDVNELFRVDPATVTLYFGREKNEDSTWSDKWLKSDEALEDWLKDGRKDDHPYVKMVPSWNLDLDYLGSNFNPGRHNIHILVELPHKVSSSSPIQTTSEPPLKKRHISVNFEEFCLKAMRTMPDVNTLPSLEELKEYLLQPWPIRVHVLKSVLADIMFAENALQVDCEAMTASINSIPVTCERKPPPNASEILWVPYYNAFLNLTLSICAGIGLDINYNRDKSDLTGTTSKNLRPDCLVYTMKGLVLLRGEEKNASVDIQIPLKELTDKMRKWDPIFYGELPYILGYATSGEFLTFVAIDKFHHVHEIISNQSVLTSQGQGNLLKLFFNLAFFFQRMEIKSKRLTTIRLLPFVPIKSSKRTLVLIDDGFCRIYSSKAHDFDRIVRIYDTLEKINRESVKRTHLQIVSTMSLKSTRLKVILKPLGFERKPITVQETREWIIAMLKALQLWHGSNFCHGDIRWRNIVLVPNQSTVSYWMLIDMDESYPPNERKIDWNHQLIGETLTFQHDLYQLGDLLNSFVFPLTVELENLKIALRESIKTKITATDLLQSLSNVA